MSQNSATMDRLVEPIVQTLTPQVAKALVKLRADPELQARMDELAEKSNRGTLSIEEKDEYETSICVGNFVGILQVKARTLLKKRAKAR